MDALQQAQNCMMELNEIEPFDYEGKEITVRVAQAYATIAQAESLAAIAKQLDMIREALGYMAQAAAGV